MATGEYLSAAPLSSQAIRLRKRFTASAFAPQSRLRSISSSLCDDRTVEKRHAYASVPLRVGFGAAKQTQGVGLSHTKEREEVVSYMHMLFLTA